jgi:PAS domain S-box-containing protein
MSERSTSEQGAAVSLEQLSTLLDSARELFTFLSPQGTILFASAGFTRLLGYPAEDLVGRPIASLLHPNDAQTFFCGMTELSPNGPRSCAGRCRLLGKDGSWRWFDASGKDCTHVPGIEAMVVGFLDVTELHRMEAERQVISEVVQALNQTANLDELLAGIHQALKKVLYAENCFVALHDPVADAFTFPFFVDQVDVVPPPPQRVGHSCTAYVFRTGMPMLIPQREFDRLAAAGEVELVGAPSPSWLGVPLKTPSATIGVLVVQHYENESAYDVRDLEFLGSVG